MLTFLLYVSHSVWLLIWRFRAYFLNRVIYFYASTFCLARPKFLMLFWDFTELYFSRTLYLRKPLLLMMCSLLSLVLFYNFFSCFPNWYLEAHLLFIIRFNTFMSLYFKYFPQGEINRQRKFSLRMYGMMHRYSNSKCMKMKRTYDLRKINCQIMVLGKKLDAKHSDSPEIIKKCILIFEKRLTIDR